MKSEVAFKNKQIQKSACPYDCFDCCGFDVHVADGKVTKITANRDADCTGGFICKKGRYHSLRMYREDRLLYPQIKTAEGHVRISWEETYKLITEKITAARERYGPLSIAGYLGGGAAGKLKAAAHEAFMAHLGGHSEFTGSICWGAGIAATRLDFGHVLGHHPEDINNSRVIVLWGRNPVETNSHLVPYIKRAKQSGCKVYLLDPRLCASAELADVYIRINPGTDWAFAAASTILLLQKNNINRTFIEHHLTDRSGVIPYLTSCGIETCRLLLATAGVSEEVAEAFTSDISRGPSSCYLGYGLQRYEHGGFNVRCIDLLWAVTGNIGIPGGGVNYANQANQGLFDFSFAMPAGPPPVREFLLGTLAEQLRQASPPVSVLLINSANPLAQLPATDSVKAAFHSIPFKICLEQFMTDTAAACELVLPVAYFTEMEDIITSGMWNSSIKYAAKCVEAPAECKSEHEIFLELAKRLAMDYYPDLPPHTWLNKCMYPLEQYGLSFTRLKKLGVAASPLQKIVPWADGHFATADGKFQVYELADLQERLAACIKKNQELYLLSVHWHSQINSQNAAGIEEQHVPEIFIHPETARLYGLVHKEIVDVVSQAGKLRVQVAVTEEASPAAAFIRQGLSAAGGGPVNELTPAGITDVGDQAVLNQVTISFSRQ